MEQLLESVNKSMTKSDWSIQSINKSEVVWAKDAKVSLLNSNPFADVEWQASFPSVVKPLHLIWKISGFTFHGSDISLFWDIWAWIFRFYN